MKAKNSKASPAKEASATSSRDLFEGVISEKLEQIATILCQDNGKKSQIYEEVVTIVERSLFKIALQRSNNIKSRAADYLGINRNTFQKKMIKLGIENHFEP